MITLDNDLDDLDREWLDWAGKNLETNVVTVATEPLGELRILLDDGIVLTLDGVEQEEGDEWTEWIGNPDFTFDDEVETAECFLGFNRQRIVAMEWVLYGAEELALLK